MLKYLSSLLLVLVIAGCMSKPTVDLSSQTIASFHLSEIQVELPPDRQMRWGHLDRRVGEKLGVQYPSPVRDVDGGEAVYEKRLAEFQKTIDTPEGQALRHTMTREVLANAVQRHVGPLMRGNRPVIVRITIEHLMIPGAFMRNIIGGAPTMRARAELIDTTNGQVLAQSPSYTVVKTKMINGVIGLIGEAWANDPFHDLSEDLAKEIQFWLKPSA
jgi:hypothetical protein